MVWNICAVCSSSWRDTVQVLYGLDIVTTKQNACDLNLRIQLGIYISIIVRSGNVFHCKYPLVFILILFLHKCQLGMLIFTVIMLCFLVKCFVVRESLGLWSVCYSFRISSVSAFDVIIVVLDLTVTLKNLS